RGPYGIAITLSPTGGGSGAVTYSVTNGSATGCSLNVASLTSTSPGTCLVIATQVNDATHLGQISNVTTVNFYWYYQGTYEETGTNYSCPSGETRENTECYTITAAAYGPYCPNGGTYGNGECTNFITHTSYGPTTGYYCPGPVASSGTCFTDDGAGTG